MELATKGTVTMNKEDCAQPAAQEETLLVDPPRGRLKLPKKKTRADRNRQRRHQQQLRRAAAKEHQKALRRSIDRLPLLMEQLQQEKQQQSEARQKRDAGVLAKKAAAQKGFAVFKLGRNRLIASPADAPLPGDLTGCLRNTKVQGAGAAAADRLRSLHRRALLELPAEATAGHVGRLKRQIRKAAARRRIINKQKDGI